MRSLKFGILWGLILLLVACSNPRSEDVIVLGQDPQSFSLDAEGRVIQADDFCVILDSDAFEGKGQIWIARSDEAVFKHAVSPVFEIQGPLLHFSKPLKLQIKPTGRLSQETYLMIREEVFVPQTLQVQEQVRFVKGYQRGEFIEAALPLASLRTDETAGMNWFTAHADTEEVRVEIALVSGLYQRRIGQLEIVSEAPVEEEVARIIWDTYNEIHAFFEDKMILQGLERSEHILVEFHSLDPRNGGTEDVLYVPSVFGAESGYYQIYSTSKLLPVDFKAQLAKAVFCSFQDIYDDRSSYWKAAGPPEHFWFNVASMAWVEGEFREGDDHNPKRYTRFEKNIVNPMYPKTLQISKHYEHGVAMASLVKFIQKPFDIKNVGAIYKSLKNGADIHNALIFAIGEPVDWLQDYYAAILTQSLYKSATMTTPIWEDQGLLNPFEIPLSEDVEREMQRHFSLHGLWMESMQPYFANLTIKTWSGENQTGTDTLEIYATSPYVQMTAFVIEDDTAVLHEIASSKEGALRLVDLEEVANQNVLLLMTYTPDGNDLNRSFVNYLGNMGSWPDAEMLIGSWETGVGVVGEVYIDPIIVDAVRKGREDVEVYGCDPETLALMESLENEERNMVMEISEESGELYVQFNFYDPASEPGVLSEPFKLDYHEGILNGRNEINYNDHDIFVNFAADVFELENKVEMKGLLKYTFVDKDVVTTQLQFQIHKVISQD